MINIIIPMAGRGERFKAAGYSVAKPLIPLFGEPMCLYSAVCLPLDLASSVTVVTLKDDGVAAEIRAVFETIIAPSLLRVVELPKPTAGQSQTVLEGLAGQDENCPLLIFNCDSYFTSEIDWRAVLADQSLQGSLVCFSSSSDRYSFARVGTNGWVDLVTEKVPVSAHACTGAYYFRRTKDFISVAQERIKTERREAGEFYVAPLYNDLISRGERVSVLPCREFICFGTPDEFKETHNTPRLESILRGALASRRRAVAGS